MNQTEAFHFTCCLKTFLLAKFVNEDIKFKSITITTNLDAGRTDRREG